MTRELIEAILDPTNWRPYISQIAKQTGMSPSTVTEAIARRLVGKRIQIVIKENTESEANELLKNEGNKDGYF